jgi:hypothetical protein
MIAGAKIGDPQLARKSIKYSLVESSCYLHFVNQCLSNSKHAGSDDTPGSRSNCGKLKWPRRDAHSSDKLVSKVYSWRTTAKFVYHAAVTYYVLCVFKYLSTALMLPGLPLDALKWMDCFIPGRYRFIGRTNRISYQMVSFLLTCLGAFRVSAVNFTKDFKFYACEFMLNDYKYVSSMKPVVRLDASAAVVKRRKRPPSSANRAPAIDSTFYLKNRFDRHRNEWILRLNRTPASWLCVCRRTRLASIVMLWVFVAWIVFVTYFLAGSIFSNIGFEMSYPACTRWLRLKQTNDSNEYSYIYVAPKVLANEMRIDALPARVAISTADFKTMSTYRFILMLLDVAENLTIYMEFLSVVAAIAHLLVINSIDIVTNATLIKGQLFS